MTQQPPELTFPCDYHVKIMGKNTPEFEALVIGIANKHIPNLGEGAISTKQSSKSHYVSITINFIASSKAQLDELYMELSKNPDILMAL